jgi:hypothetical protein
VLLCGGGGGGRTEVERCVENATAARMSSDALYLTLFLWEIYAPSNGGDCFNTHVGGSISDESDSVFTSTLSNKINLKLGGMIHTLHGCHHNPNTNLTLLMGGAAIGRTRRN